MAEQEGIKSITLEDPPSPRVGKYDWSAIAEKVKTKPNKWWKIFDDDLHSRTVSIRQGNVAVLHPDKGFIIRTSNTHYKDGKRWCSFYIKYDPTKKKRSE